LLCFTLKSPAKEGGKKGGGDLWHRGQAPSGKLFRYVGVVGGKKKKKKEKKEGIPLATRVLRPSPFCGKEGKKNRGRGVPVEP